METTHNILPIRSVIWIMLFTCTLFMYVLRTNISIILLGMVEINPSGNISSLSTQQHAACFINETISEENFTEFSILKENHRLGKEIITQQEIKYNWDTKLQGLILGAYFWGFVLSNIPGGFLAEKFGPRKSVAISFTLSAVLTLIGPICAQLHPYALIASRFFIGLLGGIVYPAVHCLISKWAPPAEKGKFVSATLGSSLGTVITWPLLGNIIERISWTWAFYLSGILVLCWTILWIILVHDSPSEHPWIKNQEKIYIISNLSDTVSKEARLPPYKSIFCSLPAWALCIAQFGNLWGLFFLMTAGPTFMSTVLGFDLGHTGFLAALPYLARMIAGFIFGTLGDLIVRKNLMKKTTVRKTFTLLSHILPGVLLISQTFVGCRIMWVIILITLSLASNGASTITNLANSQDLAPNFAGSLYGIANCIGSTPGFISPIIVGYITAENNGLAEWHKIFYIGAFVYIACGIIFIIFGSADIQQWNYSLNDIRRKETDQRQQGEDNVGFTSEIK